MEISLSEDESEEPEGKTEQSVEEKQSSDKPQEEKKGGLFSFFRTRTIRGIESPEECGISTHSDEKSEQDTAQTTGSEQTYLAQLDTLRIRLNEVEQKIEEALNDKLEGNVLDEKSWRDTEASLLEEKERLEQEIERLTAQADKAA
jgi:hypothetical protein